MPASPLLFALAAATTAATTATATAATATATATAIGLEADQLVLDEATGVLTATGHVVLTRDDVRLEASAMRYLRASGRGELTGPIRCSNPAFEVTAARATFDLTARTADLYDFQGRWGRRAQFSGLRLRLADDVVELVDASGTTCMHPDPDLALAARRFRYYPRASTLNLALDGVAVRAFGRTLLSLPEVNTHVDEQQHPGFDAWLFPAFAFDAYQGFLTATRFDFTFGEGSRGAIPIVFSSGRGLSASIEHALGLGPGEVTNALRYETPWATGQGGIRAQNGYTWRGRNGTRFDVALDYRANMNEQAVHRLPDATVTLPYYSLGGLFSYQSELRAGYLWEEASGVQATRVRWAAPFSTPVWRPVPAYQTWVSGQPWAAWYGFTHFAGGQVAWFHREAVLADLAFTQALETVRTTGQTPFVHDRLIGADRLRLGVEKDWGPRVSTSVNTSWSRLYNTGPLLLEDLGLTGLYRWNCMSLQLTLRPLVWGVDTRFNLLDF